MSTCSYSSSNGILDYLDENRFFSFLTTSTFVIIGTFLYIVSLYKYFEKVNIPRIAQPSLPYGNITDVINKDTTLFELTSKYYKKLKKKGLKYGGMYLFFKPGVILADTPLIVEILQNKTTFSDVIINKNNTKMLDVISLSEILDEYLKYSSSAIKDKFVKSLTENKQQFQKSLYEFVMDSVCVIFGIDKNENTSRLISAVEKDMTSSSFKHYFNLVYPYFNQIKYEELISVISNNMLNRKKNDIRVKDVLQNILDNETDEKSSGLLYVYINCIIKNIIYSFNSTLFCLYEITKHTDIQEELQGEIRRFNSSNKNFSDLPYLDAVIKGKLLIKNNKSIHL